MTQYRVLVTPYFFPMPGGIERYMHHRVAQSPHRFLVLTDVQASGTEPGSFSGALQDFPYSRARSRVSQLLVAVRALWKIRREIERCDALEFSTFFPGFLAYLPFRAAARYRRRTIVFFHGDEILKLAENQLVRCLFKYAVSLINCRVANSRYTADLLRRVGQSDATHVVYPLHESDMTLLPRKATNAEADLRLVTVGRLVPKKNVDFVMRALATLEPHELHKCRYQIVGEGPELPRLRALARELQLEAVVTFKGRVSDSELARTYADSNLFVLVTKSPDAGEGVEGYGIVFLEAQSLGLAVIGSRSGGIPEAMQESRTGFLIAPDDLSGLAALFTHLLRSPQHLAQMGRDATSFANDRHKQSVAQMRLIDR